MRKLLIIIVIFLGLFFLATCENGISILDEVRNTVIGPIGDLQLRQDSLEVLDGATITFLDTPTNGSRSIFFTIRNTGTGEVVLTGTNEVEIVPSDNFTVAISDSVIAPGSSVVFSISFAPPGTSTYSAEVTIETDIEELPSFSFYVEGTGTPVDNTSPTGTLSIESGASAINTLLVNLTMTSDDSGGSGVTEMKISNSPSFSGDWEPYSSPLANWPMTAGADGDRYVYVKFKDAAGNESGTISDLIDYDTVPPVVTTTVPVSLDINIMKNADIFVQFDEEMDQSSLSSTFRLYRGATLQTGTVSTINPYQYKFDPSSWLVTNTSGVTYTGVVTTGAKDLAGNSLSSTYSWDFTIRPDDYYEGTYNNNYWEDYYNLWTTSEFPNDGVDDTYGSLDSPAYDENPILWDEDWYRIHVASTDTWPSIHVNYSTYASGVNISIQVQDEGENIVASSSGNSDTSLYWEPNSSYPGEYFYVRIFNNTLTYTGREYEMTWEDCDDCGM